MKYKVLCTDGLSNSGIEELKKSPDIEVLFEKALTHDELLAKIVDYDALVVRSASTVSRDVIEAGKKLKIVARAGVGTDNIDKVAAAEKNIVVVNTPDGNTISTAELAMGMMLSLARRIPQAACAMSAGKWEKKKFMGHTISDKTLGVIGLGRIGRGVAKRAMAFGMTVIGYDPYMPCDVEPVAGVTCAELTDIFKKADFITVHTPLTKETENLISAREIEMMKPSVCLINCARGGIINENDLALALKNGRIAGAALDVFTEEPFTKSIFAGLENVILTPHLGASTKEAQDAVAVEAAQKITQFFKDGKTS